MPSSLPGIIIFNSALDSVVPLLGKLFIYRSIYTHGGAIFPETQATSRKGKRGSFGVIQNLLPVALERIELER